MLALALECNILSPREVLKIIATKRYEQDRARSISAVANRIGDSYLSELLIMARNITHDGYRMDVLVAIFDRYTVEIKQEIALETLTLLPYYASPFDVSYSLRKIAAFLPLSEHRIAFAMIRDMCEWSQHSAAEALAVVARYFQSKLRSEAVSMMLDLATRSNAREDDRVYWVEALAPHLHKERKYKGLAARTQLSQRKH